MVKGKMLCAIVNKGDGAKTMNALRNAGATGGTIIYAHGTAPTSILSMLGLGENRKEILLSMLNENIEEQCLENVHDLKLKVKGVCALLGVNEGENMLDTEWEMIQVICEHGYADDIMAAARKEGAKGGTVIKGHGTAKGDDVKFFGYPITAEKEILFIIEKRENVDKVISAIENLPFLTKKGKAVVFALPVSHFSSIG